MKLQLISALLLSFGCAQTHISAEELEKRTVRIVDTAGHEICGGTFISSNEIITASHCLEPTTLTYQYVMRNDVDETGRGVLSVNDADIVDFSIESDLAILRSRKVTRNFARIPAREPRLGDVVMKVSNAGGLDGYMWSFDRGIITNIFDENREMLPQELQIGDQPLRIIQTNMSTYRGNSGSAIFDENGNVIGVISYIYRIKDENENNVGNAIHVDEIVKFLEGNNG